MFEVRDGVGGGGGAEATEGWAVGLSGVAEGRALGCCGEKIRGWMCGYEARRGSKGGYGCCCRLQLAEQ